MTLCEIIKESKVLLEGLNDDATYIHEMTRDPIFFIEVIKIV